VKVTPRDGVYAEIAPCGAAWQRIHKQSSAGGASPLRNSSLFSCLYHHAAGQGPGSPNHPDCHIDGLGLGGHPSLLGSYLNAATIFARIFGRTPLGLWAPPSVPADVARTLQIAAWDVYAEKVEAEGGLLKTDDVMDAPLPEQLPRWAQLLLAGSSRCVDVHGGGPALDTFRCVGIHAADAANEMFNLTATGRWLSQAAPSRCVVPEHCAGSAAATGGLCLGDCGSGVTWQQRSTESSSISLSPAASPHSLTAGADRRRQYSAAHRAPHRQVQRFASHRHRRSPCGWTALQLAWSSMGTACSWLERLLGCSATIKSRSALRSWTTFSFRNLGHRWTYSRSRSAATVSQLRARRPAATISAAREVTRAGRSRRQNAATRRSRPGA